MKPASGIPRRAAAAVAAGLLILLGWFAGCSEPGVAPRASVDTIIVTPSKDTIATGSFGQFAATVLDGNGKPVTGHALTWTTSDVGLATVYQTGIAVGVAPGTVTITATGDGKSGSAQLTVTPAPPPALQVSNPLIPPAPSLVSGAAVRTSGTATLVFVAVQAGLAPQGVTATIRNRRTRLTLTTLVADGGFDPVSLDGNAGDTIDVTILSGPGLVAYQTTVVVGAPRPPVIVRTQPPAKKTDVPVNAALVVVFSEPIGPATLTTTSLQLVRDGVPVAGAVRFLDSTHVTAEFVPAAPLAPLTAYQLLAAATIHDVSDDPLATPVAIDFTTGGGSVGAVWSVQVIPSGATIVQNGSVQLTAIAFDVGDTNRIYGRPVTWSASSPAATVSTTGLVTGVAVGGATIVATVDGIGGSASVTVVDTQVVSVVVSPDLVVVPVGATHQMQTVLRDGTGSVVTGRQVNWATSAPTIATVSASGVVQGVAAGAATITATSDKGSGTATVEVQNGPILNVADLWDWTAQPWIGGVTACADTGTYRFDQQDGVPFSGLAWSVEAGNCVGSSTLSRGQVIDSALTFTLPDAFPCHFDGTLAGDPPTRFTGTETCDTDVGTVTRAIEARRHEPAGAVAIRPASLTIILGASVGVSSFVQDTAGRPVFGRVPAWSSDNPAVAVVSDSGRVTGVAVGTATISATVDGRVGTMAVTVQSLVFTSVSSGYVNAGVSTDSAAYYWGDAPFPVGGGLKLASFQVGFGQACGLVAGGAAYCWPPYSAGVAPQLVPGGLSFSSVTAGWGHACGLTAAGLAYCWGQNDSGQVGNGDRSYQPAPVAVAGNLTFTSLSAGWRHTCGIATGGTAYCWGANLFFQLGNGTNVTSLVPVAVAGGGILFRSIVAGPGHTCAITVQNQLYCWGDYSYGELGIGGGQEWPVVPVAGGPFASVSVGGFVEYDQYPYGHTCAVTVTGSGLCWGANGYGELGDGSSTTRGTPAAVAGGLTFSSISTGVYHSCGLTTGGIAYCWGAPGNGDGTSNASAVPVRVLGHP